ncbi:glutamate receptor ionotropic, kainate 3-like isoform X2 [Mercenaria mercenaria]|uniref:glutamate receptor ionotropic, kainate 3-like isoform X2 n=1 Tax=Mercenaria mercenaria TaxID=6596 RepID=UPI00234F4C86|nr:glutamate receptor ionotropic, kainate 3-like isoform X2 [Mercenaria mercenaria]
MLLVLVGVACFALAFSAETTLNAVVVGYKGKVNINEYIEIADILGGKEDGFCKLNFTALEYDTTDGKSVYESLKQARATFEDTHIAVAIGPQIDVFTSTDYVILHQTLFVTSSDELITEANRTMPILPDPQSLSKGIATIVKFLKWPKVAFLSQDDFSPVLALGGMGIFVSPIRLPSNLSSSHADRNGKFKNGTRNGNGHREYENPQLQQTLTTLRESQMDTFILHSMKKDVVKTVLLAAQKLHLLHHSIRWLITYLDFEDISWDIKGMAKIYGLQLLNRDNEDNDKLKQLNDVFNGNKSRLEQGLMGDVVGILRHYLQTHVQDCSIEPATNSSMTAEDFRKVLRNAVTPYSGALGEYIWPKVSLQETSNIRKDYSIPIYRYINKVERFAQVTFGKKEPKVVAFMGREEPHVEDPFKGKKFDVIAKQDEPFVMKNGDTYEGFCVDVLKELSKSLKFDYEIFELEGSTLNQNGKSTVWDDVITQLKVGNASMAIGAFAVTAEREARISFSYTIISSAVSLLMKRPPDTTNYFQFLGPFSPLLWMMIVVFFLTVGLGLYFMARFDSTQEETTQKFDLKESMWYSLTVLLQGSAEYSPQTTSMRTIVAFFWFCTLVINAAYTANLAAFLTLQQIDNRIKTVDSLARQSNVKYGILNNSDLMQFFRQSRDDPYERMWTFMKMYEEISLLPTRKMGLDYVQNGVGKDEYIYLDDGVINNYNAQRNCELESVEENFGVKHFSIGFPKGAPYRSDINRALLELKENGILDRLRNKWWNSQSNCTVKTSVASSKINTASELDISNMFGVFIVLIAFAVLAVLYEIGLFIFKVVRERKKKKVVIVI